MPFIQVSLSEKLASEKKEAVKQMLGETIALLPGKSEAALMLRLDDDVSMYFKGKPGQCAMIAVHLYKASPLEAKKDYAAKVLTEFSSLTGVPGDRIFMNFTEHDDWAANGALIQRP